MNQILIDLLVVIFGGEVTWNVISGNVVSVQKKYTIDIHECHLFKTQRPDS